MTPVVLVDALLGVAGLVLLAPALPWFRRPPAPLLARYLYVGSHRTYR